MYDFAIYCPMIPMQKSWMPPINVMIHTSDGHPATGSPNTSARITSIIMATKESPVRSSHRYEEIRSGVSEKLTIPSNE